MYFGREAMGAQDVPVYAMPRMKEFLGSNGPWEQLVSLRNIDLFELNAGQKIHLSQNVSIVSFPVPHRDEYSETVGFRIIGPSKEIIFIPDIDKWNRWEADIVEEVRNVDHALIDATFYNADEIGHRDISEIPHPFVIETMDLFDHEPEEERNKIRFIHINHSNPLLDSRSLQHMEVEKRGYNISEAGDILYL
jgi:pyrroloquinoline quinone biosynthesis protein B